MEISTAHTQKQQLLRSQSQQWLRTQQQHQRHEHQVGTQDLQQQRLPYHHAAVSPSRRQGSPRRKASTVSVVESEGCEDARDLHVNRYDALVQIINYEGEIVADIEGWMKQQNLFNLGFNYNVVTILGAQSSGKSSLMNALFGCNFQVMDHMRGHSQTTKGIWLGRDLLSHPSMISNKNKELPYCLVVDVEGIDSRERGEDRQTFEYRSALFALALADCLVINLWYQSLGNFTSSGYGLLRTVMEVNLELFAQQDEKTPKTILLFAVRDWAAFMTPLETVREMIAKDYVEKIWKEINKPAGWETSSPYDLFEFRVFGFAHKFMDEENFKKDVKALRHEWLYSLRPKSYSRRIPADGFAHYAASIWEVIKQQSHLNIPSQREMLATYRCQEIRASVLAAQAAEIATASAALQRRPRDAAWLSKTMATIANAAIEDYMEQASRYKPEVCMRVKREFLVSLASALQPLVDFLLTQERNALNEVFLAKLAKHFSYPPLQNEVSLSHHWQPAATALKAWAEFNTSCENLMKDSEEEFVGAAARCTPILEGKETLRFSTELILDGLRQAMRRDVEAMREKQQQELTAYMKKTAQARYLNISESLTSRNFSASGFWENCGNEAAAAAAACAEIYAGAALGLQQQTSAAIRSNTTSRGEKEEVEEKELEESREVFQIHCREVALLQLRQQLEIIGKNLQSIMVERFQVFFTYDVNDQPHQWELLSPDTLQQLFVTAKSQALELLPTLSTVQLNGGEQETSVIKPGSVEAAASFVSAFFEAAATTTNSSNSSSRRSSEKAFELRRRRRAAAAVRVMETVLEPLLTEQQQQSLRQKTLKQLQQLCRDAQAIQRGNSVGPSWRSIPLWGYLLFFVLGWNELATLFSFFFSTSSWLLFFFVPLFFVLAALLFFWAPFGVAGGALGGFSTALMHMQQFLQLFALPLLRRLLLHFLSLLEPRRQGRDGSSTVPRAMEFSSERLEARAAARERGRIFEEKKEQKVNADAGAKAMQHTTED